MTGIGGIMQRGETIAANWLSVVALLLTTAVGTFIATKLFRWEKEEKLRASAKLWVLVVLLPFMFLGAYQAWSQHDLVKARILARDMRRGQTWLIQNARIFVGNGKVIESGAVLIKERQDRRGLRRHVSRRENAQRRSDRRRGQDRSARA